MAREQTQIPGDDQRVKKLYKKSCCEVSNSLLNENQEPTLLGKLSVPGECAFIIQRSRTNILLIISAPCVSSFSVG